MNVRRLFERCGPHGGFSFSGSRQDAACVTAPHFHTPRLVPSPSAGVLLLKPLRCGSGGVRDYLAAAGKTLACAFVLRSPRTHNGQHYVLSLCLSLSRTLSFSVCLSLSLSIYLSIYLFLHLYLSLSSLAHLHCRRHAPAGGCVCPLGQPVWSLQGRSGTPGEDRPQL